MAAPLRAHGREFFTTVTVTEALHLLADLAPTDVEAVALDAALGRTPSEGVVARFKPSGKLDHGFGKGGSFIVAANAAGGGAAELNALAIGHGGILWEAPEAQRAELKEPGPLSCGPRVAR